MEGNKWGIPLSTVVSHFGASGVSVAAATGITHPLDVLKVRLQMQLVGQRGPLTGIGGVFVQLIKSEGPKSLYLGLSPALTSEDFIWSIFWGLSYSIDQPNRGFEVRLQMSVNSSTGPIFELRRIVHEEGIVALWKGVGPAMARAAALTASQLATYDETKQALMRWTTLEEGFQLHLVSSTTAGAVSTLVTAPIDMVKTRLMLQRESKQVGMYRNGFHCAYQVLRSEGTRGLYKGGLTLLARLGPQTTITFILCEKLRELAGLRAI